jgi:hypothetical protein
LDFSTLNEAWPTREGIYADEDAAVQESGKRIRKCLTKLVQDSEGEEKIYVVLVTHGIVWDFLTGRHRLQWERAEWLSFEVGEEDEGSYYLEPVEESVTRQAVS